MSDDKDYRMARAAHIDVGRSKNQGTPYVRVAFEYLNEAGEPTGQGESWDGYLTDRTAERTMEALKACGWDGKDWDDFTGFKDNVVQLTLEPESYNGKTFMKIQWVNRPRMGRPIDEHLRIVGKARAALAAQFSGKRNASPSPPPPPPRFDDDTFGEASDDDIPF